jgi:hypothetical protein
MTTTTTPRTATLLLGCGLAVAAVTLTGCSGTAKGTESKVGNTTSMTTSTATPGTTFASTIHKYSVAMPAGWHVTPAHVAWPVGAEKNAANVDTYTDGTDKLLTIASQQIPTGMSQAQWYQQYLPDPKEVQKPECFGAPESWEKKAVDGSLGGLFGRAFWCNFTEVVVIKGGRAYSVWATPDSTKATPDVFPQPVLDEFLDSMRLSP